MRAGISVSRGCVQVKESVQVPVVANGDVRSEGDVERVARETGVDGEFSEG